MATRTLWIFGDSYADPSTINNGAEEPWVSMIAKRYNVTNLAKSGTGPDYSIGLLLDMISKNRNMLDKVNVVFLVSNICRFNLKFINPSDQVLSLHIAGYSNSMNAELREAMRPYSAFERFVEDFMDQYVFHSTYNKTELLKTVGLLGLLSRSFEKMLVWPVFDVQHLVEVRNDDRFFYVNSALHDIEGTPAYGKDTRDNHLSKVNHGVMFEQLSDWVDHGTPINVSKFNHETFIGDV